MDNNDSKGGDIIVAVVLIEAASDTASSQDGVSAGIRSGGPSRKYDEGWERTFGNKASRPQDMN